MKIVIVLAISEYFIYNANTFTNIEKVCHCTYVDSIVFLNYISFIYELDAYSNNTLGSVGKRLF